MKEIWPFIVLFISVLVVSFCLEFIFGLNVIVTLLAILVVSTLILNTLVYRILIKDEDNKKDSETYTKQETIWRNNYGVFYGERARG